MFDGLDEVFDRPTQSAVIDDIIRFAQQYPKAKVLVTSRIIGYNPERFQHAGFLQFTIQPLDEAEIHEFIDRWYELAMGSDLDKVRLKQRLKDAIANSKAIADLADNPLLLTMMAILNRRQELPRDRADLYDQASRVLLYHWDVDHKRLQLPIDAIGRREKQEMLRLIAYEMQAGEEGLKGNSIGVDRLTRVLTDYLRDQGFSEPREKANQLIQQLRERNFILCYRGADSYGFVHRTFLEYFCALEIVHRFEKVRSISFEQLRDEVFGQHWQDETWHEVLKLIAGIIDVRLVGKIIDSLVAKEGEKEKFANLFLASSFLLEIRNRCEIEQSADQLLTCLKKLIDYGDFEAAHKQFIQEQIHGQTSAWEKVHVIEEIRVKAVLTISQVWRDDLNTLPWLKECAEKHDFYKVRSSAVQELARYWKGDPDTLLILKNRMRNDNFDVRRDAVLAFAQAWKEAPDTLSIIKNYAQNDEDNAIRMAAVRALIQFWRNDPDVLSIIREHAQNDENQEVRAMAITSLSNWTEMPEIADFLYKQAVSDSFKRTDFRESNPRQDALSVVVKYYPTHPKTIALLHDRAINDPDEQLREWAQQQLEQWEQRKEI